MKRLAPTALLLCLLGATPLHAQSFPSRPVTMFVSAAAGGVTDVVARAVGQKLSEMWGQPVIIENKGGAAHMLAAQSVVKAAPDGHTLLVSEAGTFVLNPSLYTKDKLGYDVEKDLVPITGLVRIYQALIASNDLPVANVAELVALAKTKPGELTYGTAGIGSALHVNIVKLEYMAGVRLQAIHYRGASPALNDIMAGHIKLMSVSISLAQPAAEGHRVKMLAVGSPARVAQLPDTPTVAESGLPGYEASTWFGLAAPGGTPRDVVMKINADVHKVLADPAFRAKFMTAQMFESMASSPEEFAQFLRNETQAWAKIIREQKLSIVE
jgi:tripartite-type tricarboxylate transporter receptor subunit TctC